MVRRALGVLAFVFFTYSVWSANATPVAINADAKGVLDALRNPALTRDASLRIAAMPGNQAIIRKSNEFKIPANTQNFADALYTYLTELTPQTSCFL